MKKTTPRICNVRGWQYLKEQFFSWTHTHTHICVCVCVCVNISICSCVNVCIHKYVIQPPKPKFLALPLVMRPSARDFICPNLKKNGIVYNNREILCPQYFYNIFTTNYRWQVVTGYYCWGKKVMSVIGLNLN